MGLDQEFISVEEAARRHPLIDPRHYIAALWDPLDGDIDPPASCTPTPRRAKCMARKYYTHTPVIETRQRAGRQLGRGHAERHDQCRDRSSMPRGSGRARSAVSPASTCRCSRWSIITSSPRTSRRSPSACDRASACRPASITRPTSISARSATACCSAPTSRVPRPGRSRARRWISATNCCSPISTASPSGWNSPSSAFRRSAAPASRTWSTARSPSAPTATR